jgi:hypothetical protein
MTQGTPSQDGANQDVGIGTDHLSGQRPPPTTRLFELGHDLFLVHIESRLLASRIRGNGQSVPETRALQSCLQA